MLVNVPHKEARVDRTEANKLADQAVEIRDCELIPILRDAVVVSSRCVRVPVDRHHGAVLEQSAAPADSFLWFNADYLMWWTKSGPVVPLATFGSIADPSPLGHPGTAVI